MKIPRIALVLPIVFANCMCSNKLGGDLKVNGESFGANGCRSGAVYGFSGVEVTGAGGRKLRVLQLPTGEAKVVVFANGAAVGSDLGVCGTISVSDQNSTINDVKNVRGKAQLSCAADGITLEGSLTFENCH